MASRDDLISLVSRIATLSQQLAGALAAQRPGDAEARELLGATVQQLGAKIGEHLEATTPAPVDLGEAARIGLGEEATPTLDDVFMPSGVQAYDEALISERVLATADLYYCYQHERLGVFRAVQKLQELFRAGTLRLTDGQGALLLYRFDRKSVLRYTRGQRMQAYRRVLGYTDAPPPTGARPNEAFHGLLTGFATQVAQLFRDKRVAEVVRGTGAGVDPSFGSVAMVRRAGLDLRANLKQASYGDVNVLTVELLQLLRAAFDILGADDVKRQFGADNAWDTLEEVQQRYMGERSVASQRSRMAIAGREILRWLAQSHVLSANRTQFETLVQQIGEYAEEWLTSAQSLDVVRGGAATPKRSAEVLPFRTRRATI
jgi:hypothetical protein